MSGDHMVTMKLTKRGCPGGGPRAVFGVGYRVEGFRRAGFSARSENLHRAIQDDRRREADADAGDQRNPDD